MTIIKDDPLHVPCDKCGEALTIVGFVIEIMGKRGYKRFCESCAVEMLKWAVL